MDGKPRLCHRSIHWKGLGKHLVESLAEHEGGLI
jgi:hypothetical protein